MKKTHCDKTEAERIADMDNKRRDTDMDMAKILPQEVVETILFALPFFRLQQLRLVSKSWNALINSENFKLRYEVVASKKWWLNVSGIYTAYHVASSTWWSFPKKEIGFESFAVMDQYSDIVDPIWTQDRGCSCCMDGSAFPPNPNLRLVISDGSAILHKQVDIGGLNASGVAIKAYGKDYTLLVSGTDDNTLFVSAYCPYTSTMFEVKGCEFSRVMEVYSSNIIMATNFYFLFVYHSRLGISALYYDLATNNWHHWDTTLRANFFSCISMKTNLVRCRGRTLAVGGTPSQDLIIVELKKPLKNDTSCVENSRGYQVVIPPTMNWPHKPGTWQEIARMPRTMWRNLNENSNSFKVSGNDYLIYVLPHNLKPGQKGATYKMSSKTWQWMTTFPEKCEEWEDLDFGLLLGDSAIIVDYR